MAITSITIRSPAHRPPAVVEIPLEDEVVSIPEARPIKIKREPVPQKGNNVAPGHEGSRRRRRYEMQHLLGCAQRVEPTAQDWVIAPVNVHHTIPWDQVVGADPGIVQPENRVRRSESSDVTRLPRAVRQELKKIHVSPAFVHGIEKELRDLIDPTAAEPEYDVVDLEKEDIAVPAIREMRSDTRRTIHVSLDAPTDKARSYSRWWIHLISKYYNLRSQSKDIVWLCDLI
ncbi:protein of unknown function [Taphrina deformans PYCC 5710]|uniref:R3H-associated N-terminal domain-containing protein n=1 Tax=Taphrina deformans (strain PYCC 5710 / ATCC 11124 / CBS 356.35 / IMI 108563 / JCM 9778 / NBRC 8474) TaxID=1097556 RepID=R4X7B7_TAPDE|nr:protein of unknown function [Taphrina deformans PYCC 5710]|eukprot:CCG81232.1 protein of unknown function [Taphrina deformans PYCC 5710]